MKIYLAGFSQGVAFDQGTQAINFLDFRKENGRVFRVKVTEEALQEVLRAVYEDGDGLDTGPDPEPVEEPEERPLAPPPEEATVFGDDSDDPDVMVMPQRQYPESEDEVPSL